MSNGENFSDKKSKLSPAKRALLEKRLRAATDRSESGITRRRQNIAPLSFAQQRLWFLDQLEPRNAFYNVARRVRIKSPLNYEALEHAINELVARHEVLRTVFQATADGPVQIIRPELSLSCPLIDLSKLPAAEQKSVLAGILFEHETAPF